MWGMKDLKKMKQHLNKDSILHGLGLETRHHGRDHILPALGIFGVGLLVGVGAALLITSKKGRSLRAAMMCKWCGCEDCDASCEEYGCHCDSHDEQEHEHEAPKHKE